MWVSSDTAGSTQRVALRLAGGTLRTGAVFGVERRASYTCES
jgi:hypothetical protein